MNDPRLYLRFLLSSCQHHICVKLNRDTSRYDFLDGASDEITSDDNIFAKKRLGLLWISALQRAARVLFIGARFIAWDDKNREEGVYYSFIINIIREREISTYNLIKIIVSLARHSPDG